MHCITVSASCKRRSQKFRRSWHGRLSCSFAACVRVSCDDKEGEAHRVKTEPDEARPFGTTRSYWLHRRSAVFTSLLKLLEETGTQCLHTLLCTTPATISRFHYRALSHRRPGRPHKQACRVRLQSIDREEETRAVGGDSICVNPSHAANMSTDPDEWLDMHRAQLDMRCCITLPSCQPAVPFAVAEE